MDWQFVFYSVAAAVLASAVAAVLASGTSVATGFSTSEDALIACRT